MDELAQLLRESPAIEMVLDKLRQLLERQPAGRHLPPMLIQGDTGTGKGLVARLVHRMGPRRGGPLVDINCPAIPETLLEAELFGFERSAFTDAHRAEPGLFQAADRGTLFPGSTSAHVHWEHRRITLLTATFIEPDGIDAASLTSRALDVVIDKQQTFGGRIEELTPTGILASFGVDPVDDASRSAAHAALVIHKGAARAGETVSRAPGIKIGLHVAPVLVGRSETRVDIDAEGVLHRLN